MHGPQRHQKQVSGTGVLPRAVFAAKTGAKYSSEGRMEWYMDFMSNLAYHMPLLALMTLLTRAAKVLMGIRDKLMGAVRQEFLSLASTIRLSLALRWKKMLLLVGMVEGTGVMTAWACRSERTVSRSGSQGKGFRCSGFLSSLGGVGGEHLSHSGCGLVAANLLQ